MFEILAISANSEKPTWPFRFILAFEADLCICIYYIIQINSTRKGQSPEPLEMSITFPPMFICRGMRTSKRSSRALKAVSGTTYGANAGPRLKKSVSITSRRSFKQENMTCQKGQSRSCVENHQLLYNALQNPNISMFRWDSSSHQAPDRRSTTRCIGTRKVTRLAGLSGRQM